MPPLKPTVVTRHRAAEVAHLPTATWHCGWELKGQLIPALSSACNRVVRSRLHRTSRQHRAKEPGAFGFQRRDKLEALEKVPSASAPTPYPYRWEPRE